MTAPATIPRAGVCDECNTRAQEAVAMRGDGYVAFPNWDSVAVAVCRTRHPERWEMPE